MKEKVYEYRLDRALSAARRRAIDQYIEDNAGRLGRPFTHQWEDGGNLLRLASQPVEWELIFDKKNLDVWASAPFWLKLAFTKKRKAVVSGVIEEMLREAGLIAQNEA